MPGAVKGRAYWVQEKKVLRHSFCISAEGRLVG